MFYWGGQQLIVCRFFDCCKKRHIHTRRVSVLLREYKPNGKL